MKSKKGIALLFLVELLLLAGFIILLFTASTKIIKNESKYYVFDSLNLALFLERIPSIDNNFMYEFKFHNPVSINITSNEVQIDKSESTKLKYFEKYQNPSEFKFNFHSKNVSKLYFYKIGNSVYIETENKTAHYSNYMNSFGYNKTIKSPSKIYYISKLQNTYNEYFDEITKEDLCTSNDLVLILYQNSNENSILYNSNSVVYAKNLYSQITESFAKKENLFNSLFAYNSFEELNNICPNLNLENAPFIILKTKSTDELNIISSIGGKT